MNSTIVLVQTIAGLVIGLCVFIYGFRIYQKEVLWPERVLLRKKREGSEEVAWQIGKIIKKEDEEGEVQRYLKLYGENIGKYGKVIDKKYRAGITTGLLNRKHNYWELVSPSVGEYYFVTNEITFDNIKGQALSSSEREHLVNSMRRSLFITQTQKTMWDRLLPYTPLISAIVIFMTVMITIFIVPKIVVEGVAERITSAVVEGIQRAWEGVNSTMQNL